MNLFFWLTFYYRDPVKDSEGRGNVFLPYTGIQLCSRAVTEASALLSWVWPCAHQSFHLKVSFYLGSGGYPGNPNLAPGRNEPVSSDSQQEVKQWAVAWEEEKGTLLHPEKSPESRPD